MPSFDPDNPRTLAACLGAPAIFFYPTFFREDEDTGETIEFFDDGTIWEEFGDTADAYEQGKEVCAVCPIREECLADAMLRRERYGLWGGLIPIERRRIERRERRKRLQERRRREALGLPVEDDEDDAEDSPQVRW